MGHPVYLEDKKNKKYQGNTHEARAGVIKLGHTYLLHMSHETRNMEYVYTSGKRAAGKLLQEKHLLLEDLIRVPNYGLARQPSSCNDRII